ncbi:uncharacterized protein CANTADRAFT_69409 [Suhomyces tanzawaensis NRRL Y-17324]|uniref:RNase MRP protein 1 RNA binding domain-containing protein n=1 Tax=Suhomyces tanzawaensis NRRL Y-17324 TaxID=984487 RepID=A0A1E4SEQ9_9ASCO|nr:uncharacterized protein CANTADRAFT_69409 [Suhomyces tanzawaensis NRRL Y-17324]ODV77997.1 hypothetical protein CANTADRAFT_69409 [Suhomyces tanzawaensis NRRL Y-17324]
MISSTTASALTEEYYILHLIYHRSKNQHRVQKWWQYLNIFHRKLRKIVKLSIDIEKLSSKPKIQAKNDQILETIRYLIKNQVFKKAYYEYNGILALGQFINLGFALLGSLSKIYALFMEIDGVKEHISKAQEQKMDIPSDTGLTTKDQNKTIDEIFGKKKKDKKPKKEKKKKKKNDMDDIFGF